MGEIPNSNLDSGEPDIYRDQLAKQLRNVQKQERREILEQAKEDPEYWKQRNKKIEDRQNEEEIDDGLGVFIKNKTLYHGSVTPGIEKFKESGDVTVGNGIYLTSEAKDAIGYSYQRQCTGNENLILYEGFIENMKLLDIRKDENIQKIMQGFKPILEVEGQKMLEIMSGNNEEEKKKHPYWYPSSRRDFVKRALKTISGGVNLTNIQDVTLNIGDLFTDYIRLLGYEGLVTIEGGEGNHRGNHDSYVIFDPEKVKIVKEQKIKKEK